MAIWHPKPGQRVRLAYRKSLRATLSGHGCSGTVKVVGRGRRAVNVMVELDDSRILIVPRGNLVECK